MANITRQTVLITGASSGIGYELARCFARDHHEIIMVAHYVNKLRKAAERLQQEFQDVTLHLLATDLSKDNAPQEVFADVQRLGLQVDILVNNAGFGEYGPFSESDLKKELAMMHLNVISLVHLTKLFLREMLSRNVGKILQVGSVASFAPSPLQSVYGATKAFTLYFSEALQEELKETGVTVTILCPPATDTNFFNVAGAQNSRLAQPPLTSPEEVTRAGYAGLMKNEARVIPTLKAKAQVASATILPDSVMATAMKKMTEEVIPKRASRAKKESTLPGTPLAEEEQLPTAPKKRTTSRKKE